MKKIIAAAVATAFIAPAYAADVSLTGLMEVGYQDSNGTTEIARGDTAFFISASTETANGISVAADINVSSTDSATASDGGNSIDLAGPFGTLELGDTSSATDKFDDRTDKDVLIGTVGTTATDAGVGWTLPELAPGLTTYISYGADTNPDSGATAHTGFGLQYASGPVTVAYADNQADTDSNNTTYVGGTVSFGGVTVSAEKMTTGASGAETSEQGLGLTYSMGDITLAVSTVESEDASNAVTSDIQFVGVKYSLGGGVTAFAETSSDDVDASAEVTAVGVAFAF